MVSLATVKDIGIDSPEEKLADLGCRRTARNTTLIELDFSAHNDWATLDRIHAILDDLMRNHRVT
jgi:uncharacterized coiled-coil protein SlyX